MTNNLDKAIKNAIDAEGDNQAANKAYLEFIKANFMIPVEKNTETEPKVLFLEEKNHIFMPVFTEKEYLANWALEIADNMDVLYLTGVDLLKGIGDLVYVCLNPGSAVYKEFNPSEIARMRSMVLKLFKNEG